jgi:hypothetical protein
MRQSTRLPTPAGLKRPPPVRSVCGSAGPARYDGVMHARPHFGDGASPQAADLSRALTLYKRSCLALWVLLALGVMAQVSL